MKNEKIENYEELKTNFFQKNIPKYIKYDKIKSLNFILSIILDVYYSGWELEEEEGPIYEFWRIIFLPLYLEYSFYGGKNAKKKPSKHFIKNEKFENLVHSLLSIKLEYD